MKVLNIFLTAIIGLAIFFLIITFGIGLPIYCRFFYYLQIEPLGLPQATGYDYATIKSAYDEVLNFLTLGAPFGTGVFKYTQSGMEHFVDCKVLFDLNAIALGASALITFLLLLLNKLKLIKLARPFNMSVAFISAVAILVVAVILVGLVAIDFNNAFTVFHLIFFPGKDNWQFSYADEIIKALPQQFFMNCAILIASAIVITVVTIITVQLLKRRKNKKF